MSNVGHAILQQAAHALQPPPRLTVSRWADTKRYLSPESSAEPGKWSTDRAPYQRGIMDAVNDPSIETVVIMSSAQVGKTEIIGNVIGYYIDQDPSPMLVIMPTLEMSEAWSKDRLAPMLRDTPCLREKVKDPRSRDAANTLLHKVFQGGHITVAGANSPASLASRPIRVVFCDEVDRYPASAGTEGDPVNLAFKRATTFWNRKRVLTSTPTIKGASRIEAAFEASDQRHYYVPCPRCDQMQPLTWAQIKWPQKAPEMAYFECCSCRAAIQDVEKLEMLRRGVWVPERPGGDVAGFYINELYSPWVRWPETVRSFLEAKKRPETLKTWTNTSLGETWEQEGESVDDGTLFGRRETYAADVPMGAAVLTAGVDIQDDRIEVEVVGWGIGEESWSITYRTFIGNPAQIEVWNQLDAFLLKTFAHETGINLRIACTFIDSGGHFTKQVYGFCQNKGDRWVFPCKGSSGAGTPIASRPSKMRAAILFHVGVDTAKELIYARLRLDEFGPGYCHFPRSIDYTEEYFKQLTAEKLRTKYRNGFPHKYWEKTRARNEALDCRVYALAALEARRVDLDKAVSNLKARAEAEAKPAEPDPVIAGSSLPPAVPRPKPNNIRGKNPFVNSWK